MKSLKRACFAVGMTAMFSMAAPPQAAWLVALSPLNAFVITAVFSLVLATLLTWLSQFHRRHTGPTWLLPAFAAVGVLVLAALAAPAFDLPTALTGELVSAIPRLILFALFCLTALQTQPASEYAEELS